MRFVIPGLTRNPVFFWIPAFAGMTAFVAIYVAVYNCHFNGVVAPTFRVRATGYFSQTKAFGYDSYYCNGIPLLSL